MTVTGTAAAQPKLDAANTFVFSWDRLQGNYRNITPMVRLRMRDTADITGVVQKLKGLPDGKRVLLLFDTYKILFNNKKDKLGSNARGVQSIWWDNGVADCRAFHEAIFRKIRNAGAHIDLIVTDIEPGMSNWALKMQQAAVKKESSEADVYMAMETDVRFDAIKRELVIEDNAGDWLKNKNNAMKWNYYMEQRKAKYINRAIFEPARQFYPDVEMCNYRSFHWSRQFPVPDLHGHPVYLYGNGAHVGTAQSIDLYGRLGQISTVQLPQGVTAFPKTPFNAMKYELNKVRATAYSSDAPLYPWIYYKSYDGANTCLNNSEYYEEMLYHILMYGIQTFLYLNQSPDKPASARDNRIVDECVTRFKALVGNGIFQPVAVSERKLLDWNAGYVLSSVIIDGRTISRITLNIPDGDDVKNHIVSHNPLVLKIGNSRVDLPGYSVGSIAQTGTKGLWVEKNN